MVSYIFHSMYGRKKKPSTEIFNALARLKPDHACLMPARLHQIGDCKKMQAWIWVCASSLKETGRNFFGLPHFDLLFLCFQSFFSLRLMFLQVSFKILVQTSRHWAGMSKETRLQNGEKISRDWSVSVAIWSSRCQSSQSISQTSNKLLQIFAQLYTSWMTAFLLGWKICGQIFAA